MANPESAIRGRDWLLLVLFGACLYYCWNERSHFDFHLEPEWFVENKISTIERNGQLVFDLINPEVVDLNGDGKKEMVTIVSALAGSDDFVDFDSFYRLQVLDIYHDPSVALSEVYHPAVLTGIGLAGTQHHTPVALAAGAEDNGHGLITVAFDNQTLTTYAVRSTHDDYRSMSLRKRWHVDLVNLTRGDALSEDARQCRYNVRIRHVNQDEVPLSSLYATADTPTKKVFDKPASLEDDDEEDDEEGFRGMVLVSLTRPSADETARLRSTNKATPSPNSNSTQPDATAEKEEYEEPVYCSTAEPLRVYALDARTGGLLWQYLGRTSSLEEEETALATALPQHPLSLDMREQLLTAQFYAPHYHPYTAHWTLYRQSLLQQLPFHWFDSQDEALYTTHFQGRTRFGDVRVKSSAEASKTDSKGTGVKSAPKDKKIRGKKKSDSRGAVRPPSGNGEESGKSGLNKKKSKQNSLLQLKVPNLLSSAASKGKGQGSSNSPHAPLKSSTTAVGSDNNRRRVSATSPQSPTHHSHTRSNVLVLKHAGGVTVLALKTGQLLAQLPLETQRVYADLDHDGNLDSLHFPSSASAPLDHSHAANAVATDEADACTVLCVQGVPPTAQRFNSTALCGEGFQNRFVHGHSTQTAGHAGIRPHSPRARRRAAQRQNQRSRYNRHHSRQHHQANNDNNNDAAGENSGEKKADDPKNVDGDASVAGVTYGISLMLPRPSSTSLTSTSASTPHVLATENAATSRRLLQGRVAVVTLASVGVVTALDETGEVLWQDFGALEPFAQDSSSAKHSASSNSISSNSDSSPSSTASFLPSAVLLSALDVQNAHYLNHHGVYHGGAANSAAGSVYLGHYDEAQVLLIVQERGLVLLDWAGRVLQSLAVPSAIVGRQVYAVDTNSDGVTETLIVVTQDALLGFHYTVKPSVYPLLYPLVVLLVLAGLFLASKIQFVSSGAGDNRSASSGGGSWWLKTTRATDSLHLD